ncbi:sigma 54-interacting transcriptional regulator [Peribacillus frigoritolerans]|nr:sigma 54-interacting transcriptional regulator [Peribacillus frigoritolerans]
MIMPTDLIGKSITRIIHTSSTFSLKGLDHKHVFSGVISGHACFIRVFRREADTLYTVIIRQDELEYSDLVYFTNSLEKNKVKKNSVVQGRYSFEEIVGKSKEIERVKELAARIATSSSTVLLTGETGTGKELFCPSDPWFEYKKSTAFCACKLCCDSR